MVRTRFAPSPTGYLHIGGVRTALFNWLFTRRHGGQFILRIDDTDAERNVEAALAPILHGFRWLGIDWDEGPEVGGPHAPYFQSKRLEHYQAAAKKLLDSGHAYRDYATADEIKAERETAEKEKRPFIYSRRWMAETPAQLAKFEAEGRSGVVRLKMPREGKLIIADQIRGNVEFDWGREQDHVIQRADGTCLYHLASVVDDHDFEITHVIRAEEHLSNTPRQVFIAQSLGYELPVYAHLPYVAAPGSKEKLSKRKLAQYLKNPEFKKLHDHGSAISKALNLSTAAETFNPVIVDFYEQVGYLPDAIINYLLLLGWSLDDKTEFFTRQQMIDNFSLERVNKAPASFDPKKLWSFQDHFMLELPIEPKTAGARRFLQTAGIVATPPAGDIEPRVAKILAVSGNRIKTFGDILEYTYFFCSDEQLTYDDEAFDKRVRPAEAIELLKTYRSQLAPFEPFQAAPLESFTQQLIAAQGKKISDIVHPLRVALTGKGIGLGLFDTLEILGRESSLRRIDLAILRAG